MSKLFITIGSFYLIACIGKNKNVNEDFNFPDKLLPISYKEIQDRKCIGNEELVKNLVASRLVINAFTEDSFSFYMNDSMYYTGPLNKISNRVSLIYSHSYKIPSLNNINMLYVDTLKNNKIKIAFFKRKQLLEFTLNKYVPLLILKEESQEWSVIYKYCAILHDE
ncbi:MAG: hypothetical protein J0M08_13755 [Bacteroidetes bacterium]|nr:hypothetical protein [Bacteroidota bacterium]